ncbi:MAG: RNA polymerase sigma factor [Acidimicrobiales bacterium]
MVDDLESDFQRGADDALRRAYDEHGSLVYSFCRRSIGSTEAADVTQEVFLAAWRAHDRFDADRGSLRGWLMGIARNKCVDRLRHHGRRPQIATAEVEDRPAGGSDIERMSDRMVLATALEDLPDRSRRLIELSFYQQLTHAEIADHTGVPLGTVKSDIRRGLNKLRRNLEAGDV